MKTIKKIDTVSVGKVSGFLYALIGFVIGGIVTLMYLFTSGNEPLPKTFSLGAVIFFPLLYGGMGFLFGVFTAFLYNISAKYTGGIRMEIEEAAESPALQNGI